MNDAEASVLIVACLCAIPVSLFASIAAVRVAYWRSQGRRK